MKVLLINPTSSLVEKSHKLKTFFSPIPPLGIASIAGVLEMEGTEVKVIDQFANKISCKRLLNEIRDYCPDIIGFSCLTPVMTNVQRLVNEIRSFSNSLIILGNIHPTIFAEEVLRGGIADIVVRAEGEITVLELIREIKKKGCLHNIKGISFREQNSIFHNTDRPLIEDLDTLPYPAWHLFELGYYKEAPMLNIDNEPILPIAGSRGCPYRCMFCAQDKIYPMPRYRRAKEIIKELEYMHNRFKVRNFGFIDANFPFSIDFGLQFCNELISSGLQKKIRWVTEIRVDLVNEELLIMMKKAGIYLIMFGIETGNKEILDNSGKRTLLEQAKKIIKITRKLKIYTLGFFMLGLPGETKETCHETIRFAKELNCDVVKFNIAVPYPGSRFFEEFYRNNKDCLAGSEKFSSWYDWSNLKARPIYVPEGMTAEELIGLQRRAMFEFYIRPRVIIKFLRYRRVSIYKLVYGAYILISKYFSYLLYTIFGKPSRFQFVNNKSEAR